MSDERKDRSRAMTDTATVGPEDFKVARALADKLMQSCAPNDYYEELDALSTMQHAALDQIAFECAICNHWFPVALRIDDGSRFLCKDCGKTDTRNRHAFNEVDHVKLLRCVGLAGTDQNRLGNWAADEIERLSAALSAPPSPDREAVLEEAAQHLERIEWAPPSGYSPPNVCAWVAAHCAALIRALKSKPAQEKP